jgi:hypothetical protein
MKKKVSLILALCLVVGLVACAKPAEQNPTDPTATPSSTPTTSTATTASVAPTTPPTTASTEIPTVAAVTFRQEGPFSKEGVSEFLDLLCAKHPKMESAISGSAIYCYNDTPSIVAAETNIQIFSFFHIGKSYLQIEDEIFVLNNPNFTPPFCESVTSALPYDFDNDGVKDLLIAYCMQTGGSYYNSVCVFNPVAKELTTLYIDNSSGRYALYVTESDGKESFSHCVYRVDFDHDYEKKWSKEAKDYISELIAKEYTVLGTAGYIEIKDNKPQFVSTPQ